MTDFKKLRKIAWASEQGRQGCGRRPNIFADHKNRYMKKNENEKKVKSLFSHATVFVKFTGVIFANRDNCPQGVKD